MTQKLGDGFEFNKKACFVCGSLNHLIKDCNFYENKMVGKSMLNNMGRVTGKRKVRPAWNNAQRSCNVPVNTAKQSSSKVAVSNSTARYVNTAATRPTVNDAKPSSNVFHKSHSSVKRTIYQRTVPTNSNFKEKVNTAKRPTGKVIDRISKDSGSYTSKRFNYVDPQGRLKHMTGNKSYLTDYQDIDRGFVAFAGSPKGGGLTCLFAKAIIDESNLWHRMLGHINFKTINKLGRGNLVKGLPSKLFENDHNCVACQKGKQHKASCKTKLVSSINQPLQMLHGPTSVRSINHKIYFLVVTDDYSSLKDAAVDDAGKKTNEEPAYKQGYANSTNRVSTISPSISAAGEIFTNVDDFPTDPFMPDFEDTTDLLKYCIKVWRLVDLPKGKHAIGTKWVYRNKKDERGIVVRNKDRSNQVEKALYGLHQAPRAWYETLSTYLLENGFRRGIIDKTLFIKKDKEVPDEFYGGAHFLLRVAVKIASTLIETNKALHKDEEAEDVDVHLYKLMIGSLMYLTASRPDIMFVVCAYARFQVSPKVSHLHAMKRIFRYLKGQPKLGLWYPRDSPFNLEAFLDSDYAGASLDRKSTTGDETIYKEWEDIMDRAATTASSLEAEQDSGNTNRTESMTTLNEPLPQETGSSSGPKFALFKNPTIYDSHIKQFWQTATVNTLDNREQEITVTVDGHTPVTDEAVFTGVDVVHEEATTIVSSIDARQGSGNITKSPTMPHDSPLLRGHTPGSDEGSMTLHELTVLCTKLSNKVESLETELKQTKQTYGAAFTKLIKKVKKLEQTVKTSQARRRTKNIASDDEEDLVAEDPSKEGRSMIEEMDLDAGISLVPPHVEVQRSTASPQRHTNTTADDLTLAEILMEITEQMCAKAICKAKMMKTESPRKMKRESMFKLARDVEVAQIYKKSLMHIKKGMAQVSSCSFRV
ncbi:ribonuclease H-like domain-containing protein [Tanacetum coccineum]